MDPSTTAVETPAATGRVAGLSTALSLALIVGIGINLRAVFGSTPPLVPLIRDDLGLNATTASLLTALPILAMGLFAPLGHLLSTRLGTNRAMVALLLALALTEGSRLWIDGALLLVLSAGAIGGALGALSTLTPAFISQHVPHLRGFATGVYSTSMAAGVALAAGTAQPLSRLPGGWRSALSVWGVAALLLALALWSVRGRTTSHSVPPPQPEGTAAPLRAFSLPLRESRAWFVTAVYMVPMILGFAVIAWLPSLFIDVGMTPARAAGLLVTFQLVQLFSILTLTPLTDRFRGRRAVFSLVMVSSTLGLLLLVLDPRSWAVPGVLLAGFGIGAASSLALVKVQDEATSPQDATRLSAMAMFFSFIIGALAPLLVGMLRDATGSFRPGFSVLLGVSVLSLLLLIRMDPAPTRTP